MDPLDLLLDKLDKKSGVTSRQLLRLKNQVAKETGSALIRTDRLLEHYRRQIEDHSRCRNLSIERSLVLNAVRSRSGVATVTLLTKPYACPGRCVYCPTEVRIPKSYLPNEPAVMRAISSDYDPYAQVMSRLTALENTGHSTQKLELIIKGGTWSFYPHPYQRQFIQRCFDAANKCPTSSSSLEEAHLTNETAQRRIIGVTIETRPDYVTVEEIQRLRTLGVTRVELGVQSLNEHVLALIVRDHGTQEVAQATQLLRDSGFKVAYHLMPNLPGATPEEDLTTAQAVMDDPSYRPDAMKIYPCVVVKSAELYKWWQEGRYHSYDDETLIELIIQIKKHIPPFIRLERVIRNIPSDVVVEGPTRNNLREEASRRMKKMGLRCRCIRCREVREEVGAEVTLLRRDYEAGGGREIFLTFEDPVRDRLYALLRLRIPSFIQKGTEPVPVLKNAALIRELHTYGWHLSLSTKNSSAAQHRGFGRRLMQEAERIALNDFGLNRMAVIAGVGVREYYRKLGYRCIDTYMIKDFPFLRQTIS